MSINYKVWVTGSKGYLGHELARRLAARGCTVLATDKEVDVTNLETVCEYADRNRPDSVINAAGMRRDFVTEDNRIETYRVNALGARNVAIASESIGIPMVQISSDDVFDNSTPESLNEFDTPHPTTIYGKSKLAGETFVRGLQPRHIILRSSWVYHADGGRLKEILDAGAHGTTIEQRSDQLASPTSVKSYIDFILAALAKSEYGIFHVTSKGQCSRYEFAAEALRLAGYDPEKVLVASTDPATAENVVLEDLMLEITGLITMPSWKEDLAAHLKASLGTKAGE